MSKKNRNKQFRQQYNPKIHQAIIDHRTKLDIVIAVHGRFDLLERCIDSIPAAAEDTSCNIILVDNASPDKDEADKFYHSILDTWKNVTIIRNKENLGFPVACNMGARRKQSPFIFMLNSDVILYPEAISKTIKCFDNEKVGVAGMKLIFPPEDHAGLNPNIRPAGKIQHIGMATNIKGEFIHLFMGWDADHPKVNAVKEPYAVTGAALMTKRSIWNKVGGFREEYGRGCLVGDTLIFTSKGIFTLKDLMPDDGNDISPIDVDLASEMSIRNSNIAYKNGQEQTLKITLEKDFHIQGTLNHKIRVMSLEGTVIWKSLEDLSIGDYVAVRQGMELFGSNHLDDDDAYLIGLYIAEGSFEKKGRITISNTDDEIITFLVDIYGFGNYDETKNKVHWRKSGKEFISWISQYIDLSKKALQKEIPSFIFKADKSTQTAFLQGMFDGDGCAIKDGRVTYSCSSYKLMKQLQAMLLNLGIVVGIYPKPTGFGNLGYTLDFGSDSSDFYSKIGFRLKRKQGRSALVRPKRSPIIPYQREHFKSLYSDFPFEKRNWKEFGPHANNPCDGVRLNTIKLFTDYAYKQGKTWNDPLMDNLGQILVYEDCVWLKVKSIEDGDIQETYDLHVPSNHAYIANGLIVHNTWEDVDYCLSVRDIGYTVAIDPTAVGIHYTGATAEKYQIPYAMDFNRLIFLQKWATKVNYTEYLFW